MQPPPLTRPRPPPRPPSKAFIGSNYLSMPFAYAQAGVALGTVLLVAIALLTDRCCALIVKCKHRAVERITARALREREEREHGAVVGRDEMFRVISEEVERRMTYGDVGREALGPRAEGAVDAALAFAQFGFCVGYFVCECGVVPRSHAMHP